MLVIYSFLRIFKRNCCSWTLIPNFKISFGLCFNYTFMLDKLTLLINFCCRDIRMHCSSVSTLLIYKQFKIQSKHILRTSDVSILIRNLVGTISPLTLFVCYTLYSTRIYEVLFSTLFLHFSHYRLFHGKVYMISNRMSIHNRTDGFIWHSATSFILGPLLAMKMLHANY